MCSSETSQFDKRKIVIWAFETRVSSLLPLAQVANLVLLLPSVLCPTNLGRQGLWTWGLGERQRDLGYVTNKTAQENASYTMGYYSQCKKMGVWDFLERSSFNGETNYHFDTSSNWSWQVSHSTIIAWWLPVLTKLSGWFSLAILFNYNHMAMDLSN